MEWIERIASVDCRPTPVYIDERGERTTGSLGRFRGTFPRSGSKSAESTSVMLHLAVPVDGREYLDAIGLPNVAAEGHDVFALDSSGGRVLVPTAVLLASLVGRLFGVGDRLFEAGSLDHLASATVSGGSVHVQLSLNAGSLVERNRSLTRARFEWLTCYPSARQLWDSVYLNASNGRLSLRPALARIDASFTGYRKKGTLYVTRAAFKNLVPLEEPYPFAAGCARREFSFHENAPLRAKCLAQFRSERLLRTNSGPAVPVGAAGWGTTDEEWHRALDLMSKEGYKRQPMAKRSIDTALQKFATGASWVETSPNPNSAVKTYGKWRKRGQWHLFVKILREIRQSSSSHTVVEARTGLTLPSDSTQVLD